MFLYYLRVANKMKMISKIFTFILLAMSNILLYYLVIVLEPQTDYRILFILVRAMLVTSILMQVLTATGFMKEEKLW